MKKITTLFKKNPENLGRVINEIDPNNNWVFDDGVRCTRKFDGTACAIINKELYKRYDVKKGKSVPENAIPCQEPDEITGHWPHWVKCDRDDPSNKWHFEAFDKTVGYFVEDGTFELIGPKIQGNPEKSPDHTLIKHGSYSYTEYGNISFDNIKKLLTELDIEGFVFHHPDGRMCKIRKSDFGIKR